MSDTLKKNDINGQDNVSNSSKASNSTKVTSNTKSSKHIKSAKATNNPITQQSDTNNVQKNLTHHNNSTNSSNDVTSDNSGNNVKKSFFSKQKNLFLSLALILSFSTLCFADLPVHDALHMQSNLIQFAKELAQHVLHHNYIVDMNGKWMSKLEIIDKIEMVAASKGIPIDKLGWSGIGRFSKERATQLSADALDDLNKIIEGKAKSSSLGNLQKDMEQIYRPAPVTSDGAKSEHALREMAAATGFINQSQKSIEQAQTNIDKLQKTIESGELKPGDLERYKVLISSYQLQIQTWQAQANNQVLRQQVAQTGLQAAQATKAVNDRLEDRYERFQAGKLIQFSPKLRKQNDDVAGVE
jgi:hypothetical protein